MTTKGIIKYLTITALFLIPVFPLIGENAFYYGFVTEKAFYFRILVEIAFASWMILVFLDAKYRPKVTTLTVAVTAFTVIVLVADLLGVNPVRSLWSNFERMEGWITIVHLWALYLVLTNFFGGDEEGRKLWSRWLNFSLLVAVAVSFYGLFQLFGWVNFHHDLGRVDALFGNESYLAVYMVFSVFISLYLFFHNNKRFAHEESGWKSYLRWLYAILAILFSIIVFETQTRGAILGLMAGLFVTLILYAVVGANRPKMFRLISVCVVGAILLVGTIFWFNRYSPFIQRSPILSRFASISLSGISDQSRLYIWPMALRGAMERPVLGWGQENFNYVFQAEYNPLMYNQEQWFDRAHNVFLDWLISAGIIGLLSYLALYVLFITYVWKSTLSVVEKSVLSGLLIGYTINNLFIFDNLASYVLFFGMLAYVDSFKHRISISRLGTTYVRKNIVKVTIVPIVAFVFIAIIYFFNIRLIRVDRDLFVAANSRRTNNPDATFFRSALDANTYVATQEISQVISSWVTGFFLNTQVSSTTKQTFIELTANAISSDIGQDQSDSRSYYIAGSFLDHIGQFSEAEKYLFRAHELSPTRQIFDFELAVSYLAQNKNDQALAVLRQAYESAPQYDKATEAYSMMLMISGNEDDARAIPRVDQKALDEIKSYEKAGQFDKILVLFQGMVLVSQDFNVQLEQAAMEYSQGLLSHSVETLQSIEAIHPELKDSIEIMITQIEK